MCDVEEAEWQAGFGKAVCQVGAQFACFVEISDIDSIGDCCDGSFGTEIECFFESDICGFDVEGAGAEEAEEG
ncbi:hypothetical protein PMIN02_009325 [Paraphaeosphaeria minitans]